MGSVDGQQHVAILLNGTGAPQYRFILAMTAPGALAAPRPRAGGHRAFTASVVVGFTLSRAAPAAA